MDNKSIEKCPKCDYWRNSLLSSQREVLSLRDRYSAARKERDVTIEDNEQLKVEQAELYTLLGTDNPAEAVERVKELKEAIIEYTTAYKIAKDKIWDNSVSVKEHREIYLTRVDSAHLFLETLATLFTSKTGANIDTTAAHVDGVDTREE
jgi:regulator of replication initiation timing